LNFHPAIEIVLGNN